jgi:fatty-acyl-CoA synthase
LRVQLVSAPGGAPGLRARAPATSIHAWPHQQKAIAEHPSAARRDLTSMVKIEVHSPIAALAGVKENLYDYGTSYGLSETFTICSATRADAPAAERRANNGPPCPGMQLRIVDPATGAPLDPGAEGEIAVKGVTLMRGYYKVAPEQVFDADGYYHTQDGGSIDARGRLVWNGRLGNLIKTGGANVSPVELQEILESHPGLKVGIPIGVEHPTLGEALVLCAVPLEGASPDEAEVRAWLRARVAAYKVPRRVLFFRADELAYTGNQKIQLEPLKQAALRRLREERAEIQGHRFEPT